jgi:hypothetical protein
MSSATSSSKDSAAGEGAPSFTLAAPQLSLPKGGGVVRGIGEKFAASPVMGTGSISVPVTTSPGRSGFGPQLSISYDAGAGNGSPHPVHVGGKASAVMAKIPVFGRTLTGECEVLHSSQPGVAYLKAT